MDDLQNYIFDNSVDMEEMADASTAADHYKTALQGYLDIISEFYQKMTYYKRNLHRAISEKNIEDTNFYYNRINMLEEALQVANITPETIASSTLEWGKAHKSYDTAREISENANRVSIYADGPGICPCK